ncbi:MAG TPA: hypothetical protein VGR21_04820 [Cryptosporangiaceae bacterium]|nr:hypothetical protein [Cryptosporangiaceae bacterium]
MRTVTTTAAVLLALAAAGCSQQSDPTANPARPTGTASASPTGTASGSPAEADASVTRTPPAAAPTKAPPRPTPSRIRQTDWRNVTLTNVPTSVCGGGTIRFHDGSARRGTDPDSASNWQLLAFDERPAYGDVDGNGAEDAVLSLGCYTGRPDHPDYFLVAVRAQGAERRVFGVAGREPHTTRFRSYRIEGRDIVVEIEDTYNEVRTTNRYHWNGSRFE